MAAACGAGHALAPAVTGSPASRQPGSPPSSGRAEKPRAAAVPRQGRTRSSGPPAVSDDIGAVGEFGEPGGELVVGHVDRAGDVARGVFGLGPHVQDQDLPLAQPAEQLVLRDRFQLAAARGRDNARIARTPPMAGSWLAGSGSGRCAWIW